MALNLFPENMMPVGEELSLDAIASKLFYFYIQLQVYHWQTPIYREHQILGDLYEFIDDRRDSIVENIMGRTGMRPMSVKVPPIDNYMLGCSLMVVENLSTFGSQLKRYADNNKMLGVSAIADEIVGECDKTKYLLSLGGGRNGG